MKKIEFNITELIFIKCDAQRELEELEGLEIVSGIKFTSQIETYRNIINKCEEVIKS